MSNRRSKGASLNGARDAPIISALEAGRRPSCMEHDGLEKLRAYLTGITGGSCTLPFERLRELTGEGLPEAATSSEWWSDSEGWPAWPASSVCQAAGWRLESAHTADRLLRLERTRDSSSGGQA